MNLSKIEIILILSLSSIVMFSFGCDKDHKKKCEWLLVPDIDRKGDDSISEGFIPVCARNYIVNKQDCRLQTTLDYAKDNYGKKFRYVDLKIKNVGIPRTIDTIDFSKCSSTGSTSNETQNK